MELGRDDYQTRQSNVKLKTKEETTGITTEGFQDATGEYPKPEYHNHTSINKAALGEKVNVLALGQGHPDYPIPYFEQMPSVFPFNQVQQTPSGHTIEVDDTPGGERILIRHRKGTGIELKPDGSFVAVSKTNKIETVGGSQDVIIDGNANMIYKSNLNMEVAGDMNVKVKGNYFLEVNGYMKTHIRKYVEEIIDEYLHTFIQGSEKHYVGESQHNSVEQTIKSYCKDYIEKYATKDVSSVTSTTRTQTYYLHSPSLDIYGINGAVGGPNLDFHADTMSATTMYASQTMMAGQRMKAPTFEGTLNGTADLATHSGTAAVLAGGGVSVSHTAGQYQPIDFNPKFEFPLTGSLTTNTFENNMKYVLNVTPMVSKIKGLKDDKLEKVDVSSEALLDIDRYENIIKYHPTASEAEMIVRKYPELEEEFLEQKLLAIPEPVVFESVEETATEEDKIWVIFDKPSQSGISPNLYSILVATAKAYGEPLYVNSGFRTVEYNASVGGAKESMHTKGLAADISTTKMSNDQKLEFINIAVSNGIKGIGIYDTFIHLDLGSKRAWGPNSSFTGLKYVSWAVPTLSSLGYRTA